ncbi:MAG: 5'-deoxyadenosine deaminase, partial [Pyrinomonadaceae bacterium]
MSKSILIKGGTIVTMDAKNSIVAGDLLIRDKRIERIVSSGDAETAETVVNATGCAVLPGFVQTHIH